MNIMRMGPRPFPVHMGLAASVLRESGISSGTAAQHAGLFDMQKMLSGIQKYQAYAYESLPSRHAIVWEKGTVKLEKISAPAQQGSEKSPLVLIPSLVNKGSVFDLCEEYSLVRWMAARGRNVYRLDWGDICASPGQDTLERIILERLVPALEFVSEEEGRACAALGYCMGGTLLVAAARHCPRALAGLVFLAAPWDFHAGAGALRAIVEAWASQARILMEGKGFLPVDWLQTVFAHLDPQRVIAKFSRFSDMDMNSPEARLFVAVEDWLNDGIDLPKDIAESCLRDWYEANDPASGRWVVGGTVVDPRGIDLPALVIASKKDRLVEYESAAALGKLIPGATLIEPDCGHIGMMAGGRCREEVWEPVSLWLEKTCKSAEPGLGCKPRS